MKVKVEIPFFGPDGVLHQAGEILELSEAQAMAAISGKFATEVKEAVEKREPLWQHRIGVSQGRSLTVAIWPPLAESKFQSPSVVLDEGRKSENGVWEHNRIYLPGGRLLELAEALRIAWQEYRRHLKGEEAE